jgi:hypothetical protein
MNCVSGVMISVLPSSAVVDGFESQSDQSKPQNQDNVSEWGDMSIFGLLFNF